MSSTCRACESGYEEPHTCGECGDCITKDQRIKELEALIKEIGELQRYNVEAYTAADYDPAVSIDQDAEGWVIVYDDMKKIIEGTNEKVLD